VNRSKNQFWASGGSLGLNREYSIGSVAANERLGLKMEYSSARLEAWLAARLGLNGLNMARVDVTRRLPLERVGCAWSNSAASSGGACGLPPYPIKLILAPVSSYG
jgi:hypothetical protein